MSELEVKQIINLPRMVKHRTILLKDIINRHNNKEITEQQFNRIIKHLGGSLNE